MRYSDGMTTTTDQFNEQRWSDLIELGFFPDATNDNVREAIRRDRARIADMEAFLERHPEGDA